MEPLTRVYHGSRSECIEKTIEVRLQRRDARSDTKDYTTVDFILHTNRRNDHWHIAASARNLFDADVREPSLAPGQHPQRPTDGAAQFLFAGGLPPIAAD